MISTKISSTCGEFLLMLLIAVAIVGILAGILAPVLSNKLDDAQIRGEAEALKSLRKDFEATYDSVDFDNLNESSIDNSGLPAGTVLTTFDQGTGVGPRIYSQGIIVDPAGWVTKLALKRGVGSYILGKPSIFGPNSKRIHSNRIQCLQSSTVSCSWTDR